MWSGGVTSWAAAARVAERHGTDELVLLFADTLMEDEDLYRFLDEVEQQIGGRAVRATEGRDPWQVFFDVRYLGNTRVDPCSRVLKRELLRDWLDSHCDPAETTVYLGYDWTEQHRVAASERHWSPWRVESPLTEPPYLDKAELLRRLRATGICPPRLYELGFPHNNCGGFCVKAGQAQFALLLRTMPDRYAYHEQREQELRDHLGAEVAILRDRRGGDTKPMTLRAFREQLEVQPELFDASDWAGCGCFVAEVGVGERSV